MKILRPRKNALPRSLVGPLALGLAVTLGTQLAFGQQTVPFQTNASGERAYPLAPTEGVGGDVPLRLDWGPVVEAVLEDLRRGVAAETISARFHNGLVEGIVRVAHLVGEPVVALSGGCFQNRWLLERTTDRLEGTGHRVLLHRRVPPNDGGISLGQALVAAAQARRDPSLLEPTRDPK